jgi:hypothetical protein
MRLMASFVPAYLMSNVPGAMRRDQRASGEGYVWKAMFKQDTWIPMVDVQRDFGRFVAACLEQGATEKCLFAASGWFTPMDVCRAGKKGNGEKVCV